MSHIKFHGSYQIRDYDELFYNFTIQFSSLEWIFHDRANNSIGFVIEHYDMYAEFVMQNCKNNRKYNCSSEQSAIRDD